MGDFFKQVNDLRAQFRKDLDIIYLKSAVETTRFTVGDFITTVDEIIKIENISYKKLQDSSYVVVYEGSAYGKNGEIVKMSELKSIADDGSNNIRKIEL